MAGPENRTPEQKRRIRRTALVLAAVALVFYFGFIVATSMSS